MRVVEKQHFIPEDETGSIGVKWEQPLVCAILLTKDRPAMAARAVRAFREQTYQNKRLLVFDTGERDQPKPPDEGISYWHRPEWKDSAASIGELRNISIGLTNASIIVTWDSDDVSHPSRIAEQVAHLQSSGADVVGYNQLLFWRTWEAHPTLYMGGDAIGELRNISIGLTNASIIVTWDSDDVSHPSRIAEQVAHRERGKMGEAWLYKAPHGTAPGTSLCYWRKTWERKPFPDMPNNKQSTGEDVEWLKGLNLATVPGFGCVEGNGWRYFEGQSRLIASIHGGNTMSYDLEGMIARGSREWKRTPEWDEFCRESMVL
jgi:glycosyltransferase involved in cell wall biosynthesis